MTKHITCLTFDFDGVSSWSVNGQATPTMLSRGEFGGVGALRVLDLLKERGIKSTWFIPGVTIETYPEICERVVAEGHEVGHHGWSHVPPAKFTREEEAEELAKGNAAIRRLTGQKARGYRSPSWDLSPHSVELLLAEGFIYDSSMMGDDYTPYYARQGDVIHRDGRVEFGAPSALLEMPISWSTDDFPHFEYLRSKSGGLPGLRASSAVLENWLGDFEYMRRFDWGILTYTCHPLCIGRGHRMLMLEKLIDGLAAGKAEFLTVEEAVAEYKCRKKGAGSSLKAS
ncbi:MAG: polysaccharide deacetylase [Alphaproteobacteria bacterium]|nr:MAG: polysaccharide deacetylase [Alphaproteobacteria bacterium]